MSVKSLLISLLISCLSITKSKCLRDDQTLNCVLYNEEYDTEYLYAASGLHKFALFRRNVYTWSPFYSQLKNGNNVKEYTEKDMQGVWAFSRAVSAEKDTFFIKNVEYNEYLYASSIHAGITGSRRRIYTWKWSNDNFENQKAFMWTLKKADESGTYQIWNVHYNQPLYAASFWHRTSSMRRNVYTWYTEPDSKQFIWHIKCKDDIQLID